LTQSCQPHGGGGWIHADSDPAIAAVMGPRCSSAAEIPPPGSPYCQVLIGISIDAWPSLDSDVYQCPDPPHTPHLSLTSGPGPAAAPLPLVRLPFVVGRPQRPPSARASNEGVNTKMKPRWGPEGTPVGVTLFRSPLVVM